MKKQNNKTKNFLPRIYINGAGVLHVNSSELVKTTSVKQQIEALSELKKKGFMEKFMD